MRAAIWKVRQGKAFPCGRTRSHRRPLLRGTFSAQPLTWLAVFSSIDSVPGGRVNDGVRPEVEEANERAALLLLVADQACERIAKSWPYLLDIGEPCPRDLSVEILDQLVLLLDGLVVRWTGRKRPERVALIQRDLDWLMTERLPAVRARREEPARGPAPVLESAGPKGLKIPLSGQPLFGGLVSRPMTWRTSSGFLFRLPRSFGGTAI